jgi:hypothetical protein
MIEKMKMFLVVGLILCMAGLCNAEQVSNSDQPVKHSFLCSDIGTKTFLIMSVDGKVEWEYPVEVCTDAWMLKNGNVLFTFWGANTRGVREVNVVTMYAFSLTYPS